MTEYFSDKTYCVQRNGTIVFTFNSPELTGPDGIMTDREGNVYVVGRKSNNIHRLSSDGTRSEIVLAEKDGLENPITLCFSSDYTKLFVSNETGHSLMVFKCEY